MYYSFDNDLRKIRVNQIASINVTNEEDQMSKYIKEIWIFPQNNRSFLVLEYM